MNIFKIFPYYLIVGLIVSCNRSGIILHPIPTNSSFPSPNPQIQLATTTSVVSLTSSSLATPTLSQTIKPINNTTPVNTSMTAHAAFQILVDKAIEDLAIRLSIAKQSIQVLEVNEIELSHQDWECIRSHERIELPAYTIGVEILLKVNHNVFRYIGHGMHIIFCQ
jgi:hypothetical protein